ncbi:hypothetical protein PHYSODRAFT_343052, partial [Phytophthora sojae]
MILCAIVGLVDADSFRALRSSREDVLFAYLTYTEGMDQLELVVDALPNAGESLFRLYLATCSGRSQGRVLLEAAEPRHGGFLLERPGREEQWLLLSKEYEKNDNERKARKLRRASVNASDFDIEIEEDTTDGRSMSQSSTAASIERFQIIMLNYLRHHSLSSAQLLQLVSNTFLLMLEERTPASPLDVNSEYVAAIRLKMLKTLFKMLSREERAAWIDRINFKHPTDSYKKRIQDLKDAVAAAKSAPPDLSDPGAHISRMKADLKVRWLEAIMEYALNETESSARLAALNQALQPFANGESPLEATNVSWSHRRVQKLQQEAVDSGAKNAAVEMRWADLFEDAVIREFQNQLKAKDEEYVAALKVQAEEVEKLVDRMSQQYREMQDEYELELEQMEDAFLKERDERIANNKLEIDSLFERRREMEMVYMEAKQTRDEQYLQEIEELRVRDAEDYNELKIKLETNIQTLEQQLEEMRATYQLNTERLEYNYRVLTERDMLNSATLSQQKRRL